MLVVERVAVAHQGARLVFVDEQAPLAAVHVTGQGAAILAAHPALEGAPLRLDGVRGVSGGIDDLGVAVVDDFVLKGARVQLESLARRRMLRSCSSWGRRCVVGWYL